MIECYHCGVEYEIILESSFSEASIDYCPCCGELFTKELDFDSDD